MGDVKRTSADAILAAGRSETTPLLVIPVRPSADAAKANSYGVVRNSAPEKHR
jgi:hypothetical protein